MAHFMMSLMCVLCFAQAILTTAVHVGSRVQSQVLDARQFQHELTSQLRLRASSGDDNSVEVMSGAERRLTLDGVNRLIAKQFGFELPLFALEPDMSKIKDGFVPAKIVSGGDGRFIISDFQTAIAMAEEAASLVPKFIHYGAANAQRYPGVFSRASNQKYDLDGNFIGDKAPDRTTWFSGQLSVKDAKSTLAEKLVESRQLIENARNAIVQGPGTRTQKQIDVILAHGLITLKRRVGNCAEHAALAATWMYYNIIKGGNRWEVSIPSMGTVAAYKGDTKYTAWDCPGIKGVTLVSNTGVVAALQAQCRVIKYDHAFVLVKDDEDNWALSDPWGASGISGTAVWIGPDKQKLMDALKAINALIVNDKTMPTMTKLQELIQDPQTPPERKALFTWIKRVWGKLFGAKFLPLPPVFGPISITDPTIIVGDKAEDQGIVKGTFELTNSDPTVTLKIDGSLFRDRRPHFKELATQIDVSNKQP